VNFFNPFPVFHDKTQKSLTEYPLLLSLRLDSSTPPPFVKEIFEREKTNKYEKKGRDVNELEKEKKQAKAFCIWFQGLFWVRMAFKKIIFDFLKFFS